ncbi:MAG: T9SS type A sorting domain-containing protein [Syntrophomonadaceae bacterium]
MFRLNVVMVILFLSSLVSAQTTIDTLALFPDTTTFINSHITVVDDVVGLGVRHYCDSTKDYLLNKIIVMCNGQINPSNPAKGSFRISIGALPEDSILYESHYELTTGYPNWEVINLENPVPISKQKCFYITGLGFFMSLVPSINYHEKILDQFQLRDRNPLFVWYEGAPFFFAIKSVVERQTSGVDDHKIQKVSTYSLAQNYPNPFNSETIIKYNLPVDDQVKIEAIDLLGRVVKELYSGYQKSGEHKLSFNAEGLSGGIYFIIMLTPSFSDIKKVVYLK